MEIVSIRRYPVKSMGGEALDSVDVDARGVLADRWYAVEDADGRWASGKNTRRFRRRDTVFDYAARTEVDGGVLVESADGSWRVGTPELDVALSEAMGERIRVRAEQQVSHQDAGAVSLVGTASLQWCHDRWGLDADSRRLRVNLVVRTDEPFVEETWVGSTLGIGDCRLRVVERVERCRTVDVAQDGAVADGQLLRALAAEREMSLAVYADVARPGTIRVGDPVRPI